MKKTVLTRIITFLVLATMLISAVACTNTGNGDSKKTDTQATDTSKTDVPTDSGSVSDKDSKPVDPVTTEEAKTEPIPSDLTYTGKVIRILYWQDVEHEEFFVESSDGDQVTNALFKRNHQIESRLGIELKWEGQDGNSGNNTQWNERMKTIHNDNNEDYSIFAGYSLSVAASAVNGYCKNLLSDDCTYLNFDNAWWPERLISEATFGDNLFFASGDISANALYMMYVCYVNTTLLTNNRLQNPQELVEPGNWTYAKFIEMCEGVYDDTDGTPGKSLGDTFGYMTSGIHTDPWFYGTGALIAEYNGEGKLSMSESMISDKVDDTYTKVHDLLYATNDGMYTSSVKHQTEFASGHLLFMMDRCRCTFKVIANGNYDVKYAILPCPKYNQAQDSYVTVMGNPFTLYGIFNKASNPEMASAVMEYYAYQSYELVTPAVFEFSLKSRYVQDDISSRMYDIVKANLSFDIGRIFSTNIINQAILRNPYINTSKPSWTIVVSKQKAIIDNKCSVLQEKLESFGS